MIKLSTVVPVELLLHAPYSLSRLDGGALKETDIIPVPCIRGYFQQLKDLVLSGEIHQVVDSFYLVPSQESPRKPRLPSLAIEYDITIDELKARHLPSHPINTKE